MPKQKTHSGAKKRYRVTKNGKVLVRQKNRAHILEKKSSRRKRRLAGDTVLTGGDATRARRLLKQ
jgi:large subunit ribosomal protein L35